MPLGRRPANMPLDKRPANTPLDKTLILKFNTKVSSWVKQPVRYYYNTVLMLL